MPPAGFEPAIAGSERRQTHALNRAGIGIGTTTTTTTNNNNNNNNNNNLSHGNNSKVTVTKFKET
jgi:hypothetical protein